MGENPPIGLALASTTVLGLVLVKLECLFVNRFPS
jgi:hypothetical protein